MELLSILQLHWFELLQSGAIVAGLIYPLASLRAARRSDKATNTFAMTAAHRELWSELYRKAELRRVLQSDVNLETAPVTDQESLFVRMLLLHLTACLKAHEQGVLNLPPRLLDDVRLFFQLPIPASVFAEEGFLHDPLVQEQLSWAFSAENETAAARPAP